MKPILVTGAAGFIGSRIAYSLWQQGQNVILLDNFSYGHRDNLIFPDHDFCSEIFNMDIREQKKLDRLFKESDFQAVYHMAAITPLPDCQSNPSEAISVNVQGTVNILENCRRYNVPHLIFASTSAVYENTPGYPSRESCPLTPPTLIYSLSKYMAEQLCVSFAKTYCMNATALRFANVYGPGLDCLRLQPPVVGYLTRELYYNRRPVLHSDGNQKRDFIFIDDLVELATLVQSSQGFACVNVSSNQSHSINEIAKIIRTLMGKEMLIPEYQTSSNYWNNYPSICQTTKSILPSLLEKEVTKFTLCDNSYAKARYGWIPRTNLEQGLKITVDYIVRSLNLQEK